MQLLVPYDSHESAHLSKEELAKEFAAVPQWMTDLNIPAGIPMPIPPVAYCFHTDLIDDGNEQIYLKLERFLKIEYCALVIAFCWNEMFEGGRQFVLAASTVQFLRIVCGSVPIVKWVPTTDILNMMTGMRIRDVTYWNTLVAGLDGIPDSKYKDNVPGTNDYAPDAREGTTVVAAARSRRLRLVLRHHSRMQRRRASPLSMKLQVSDLLQILGLEQYVKKMHWLSVDDVSVRTILERIFSRFRTQCGELSETKKKLRTAEFERDGYRAAVAASNEGRPPPRDYRQHVSPQRSFRPSREALPFEQPRSHIASLYSQDPRSPVMDRYEHEGRSYRRDPYAEEERPQRHEHRRPTLSPARFPFRYTPTPSYPAESRNARKRSYSQYGEGQRIRAGVMCATMVLGTLRDVLYTAISTHPPKGLRVHGRGIIAIPAASTIPTTTIEPQYPGQGSHGQW